jgi:hydrogenase maturation protease
VQSDAPQGDVLVLGIGNVLLCDEGVGPAVVRELAAEGPWPPQVRLVDGGTLGTRLLPLLEGARALIVVDAVASGSLPGSVLRFDWDECGNGNRPSRLAHDAGVAALLDQARVLGIAPPSVTIIGVEPADAATSGTGLSPAVAAQLGEVKRLVREEIRAQLHRTTEI